MKEAFEQSDRHAKALGNIEGVTDLADRVAKLEGRADKTDGTLKGHDDRITWCEDEIKKIKNSLENMGKGGENIDASTLMMRINMLAEDLKNKVSKADLEKLRLDLIAYTDKECAGLEKRTEDKLDGLRYEIERLRADFENFKNKDFADLVARVAALEKKFATL